MNTDSILDLILLLDNADSLQNSQTAMQEKLLENIRRQLRSCKEDILMESIENYTAIVRESALLEGFIRGIKLSNILRRF